MNTFKSNQNKMILVSLYLKSVVTRLFNNEHKKKNTRAREHNKILTLRRLAANR